jgi:glycosyltransferase involved in cell wall biosynthesis
VSVLSETYNVPLHRMIVVSHHEMDIRMLIESNGADVFEEFAAYGVVSHFVYCSSLMQGVRRAPMLVSLGIDYSEFVMTPPDHLETVGYASSMSVTTFGVEWKRGYLAEAAACEAGLAFKVAGSTEMQMSFHDMPQFYQSVDAVLMSSISEAGPLPVMEAAAAGRLVIGTPVGHFPLKAYQGGGIIAPIEPDKFIAFTATTLRHYKANRAEFVEKCAEIQEAAQQFDWKYSIQEWMDLLNHAN